MTIKEDYVTIELAKKLKEKGFPQGNKDDITEKYYTIDNSFTAAVMMTNGEDVKWYCPTISQVLKWLREQDIMVEIIPSLVDDGTWTFSFRIQTKKFYDRAMTDYNSYEEAVMECIGYILDNLMRE